MRRKIVAVVGSGDEPHRSLAAAIGRWVAEQGYHLLTGGGGGVMSAVSEAFCAVDGRPGIAIGITKGRVEPDGRVMLQPANPWVELAIRTHLPHSGEAGLDPASRNHINVLSADLVIALPGGAGTRAEVQLAVRYGKPVIAYLGAAGRPDGWPPDVAMAASVEDVEAFATRHLGAADRARR